MKERPKKMAETVLLADMWANGYPIDEAALKKLAADLETLQADAETILLQIEKALPPITPEERRKKEKALSL